MLDQQLSVRLFVDCRPGPVRNLRQRLKRRCGRVHSILPSRWFPRQSVLLPVFKQHPSQTCFRRFLRVRRAQHLCSEVFPLQLLVVEFHDKPFNLLPVRHELRSHAHKERVKHVNGRSISLRHFRAVKTAAKLDRFFRRSRQLFQTRRVGIQFLARIGRVKTQLLGQRLFPGNPERLLKNVLGNVQFGWFQ